MYDVIIVGAGPAGSSAAIVLAREGRKVLLIDRMEFPRDKVCGDLIGQDSIDLLRELGVSLESAGQFTHRIRTLKVVSPRGQLFECSLSQCNTNDHGHLVVPRRRLDRLLMKVALECGVDFETLTVTNSLIENGIACGVQGVRGGTIVEHRAWLTIGADGVNSVIARSVHPERAAARYYGVGSRAYFTNVQGLDDGILIRFNSAAEPGYGWIFSLGDAVANVGIGFRLDFVRAKRISLGRALKDFLDSAHVRNHMVDAAMIGRAQGWLLPFATRRLKRSSNGVLLVGDAGAFVSPLTGGGIYNALVTGRIAGRVASDAIQKADYSAIELHRFEEEWRRSIGNRLRLHAILQSVMKLPGVLDLLVRQMARSEHVAQLVLNHL